MPSHPEAQTRPLTASERRWVSPYLSMDPSEVVHRDPDETYWPWQVKGLMALAMIGVLLSLLELTIYGLWAFEPGLDFFVLLVMGIPVFLWVRKAARRWRARPTPAVHIDPRTGPLAYRMEGPCSGAPEAPRFRDQPCILPPGWRFRFPEGTTTLEVVPGFHPPSEEWYWIAVGMGSSDRLETEIECGLLDFHPDSIRSRMKTLLAFAGALLMVGFSGPRWGFESWDNFLRREFSPLELRRAPDLAHVQLDPGRELFLSTPQILSEHRTAPGQEHGLIPVVLEPGPLARTQQKLVIDSLVARMELQETWLGDAPDSLKEWRHERLLRGPDPSLAGNPLWDALQSDLAELSQERPHVPHALEKRKKSELIEQAFSPEGIAAMRNAETEIQQELAALAYKSLESQRQPFWIRGKPSLRWSSSGLQIHPYDSILHALAPIRKTNERSSDLRGILDRRSGSGWIVNIGGRDRSLVYLVVGWLLLAVALISWTIAMTVLQHRRNRRYLAASEQWFTTGASAPGSQPLSPPDGSR